MKRTVTTALSSARAQERREQLASRNLSEICATTVGCIAPRYSKPGTTGLEYPRVCKPVLTSQAEACHGRAPGAVH